MSAPTPARAMDRLDVAMLLAAVAVFLALAWRTTAQMMVFSEELIAIPTPAGRVVSPSLTTDGRLREAPSCLDAPRPRYVLSDQRPAFALCARGRSYPVMSAPNFAGFFLWPVELLRPWHRDDPFALRRLLLVVGVLALLLTRRIVADLAGARLASYCVLALAASPCFVVMTSIMTHFETVPWLWLLAAAIVFAGERSLSPRAPDGPAPSTARLVAGAFCVGLAGLANVKALFFAVPLAALAWRLGVRVGRVRPAQWAMMFFAALVALTPMALPAVIDPTMSWSGGGRGMDAPSQLARNLMEPEKLAMAVRDLLLFWSNFGYYFVRDELRVVPLAMSAGVFAFVMVDTARTLRRREGCVVTAACGVVIVTYILVVALLYGEFPANFTPLWGIFGAANGAAAHRLAAVVRRWAPSPVAALAGVALMAPFAVATAQTNAALREVPFVTNSHAERALVRHLDAHPRRDTEVVTVNLLMAGVLDMFTAGRVRTVQAHALFNQCEQLGDEAATAPCLRARWSLLLAAHAGPVRVVLPVSLALVRRRSHMLTAQRDALAAAAGEAGRALTREAVFRAPAGAVVSELYVVEPGRPVP